MTGEEASERDFAGGYKIRSQVRRSIPQVGKEKGGMTGDAGNGTQAAFVAIETTIPGDPAHYKQLCAGGN